MLNVLSQLRLRYRSGPKPRYSTKIGLKSVKPMANGMPCPNEREMRNESRNSSAAPITPAKDTSRLRESAPPMAQTAEAARATQKKTVCQHDP